jgi:predicted transcriptional regulator
MSKRMEVLYCKQINRYISIWKPPVSRTFKANWDAAVNAQKGQIGVGIIFQNCERYVLTAPSSTFFLAADPTIAEA